MTFLLFLILGLAVFIPLQNNARLVAMVVFAVLLVLWLFLGNTIPDMPKYLR